VAGTVAVLLLVEAIYFGSGRLQNLDSAHWLHGATARPDRVPDQAKKVMGGAEIAEKRAGDHGGGLAAETPVRGGTVRVPGPLPGCSGVRGSRSCRGSWPAFGRSAWLRAELCKGSRS